MNKPANLLLVDDHKLVIEGIKSMLEMQAEFIVEAEATSAEEAIALLQKDPQRFDMVISDISMSGMSGTQLCAHIKKEYPHLKVIMLSMHNHISIIKEVLESDADGYLIKNTGREEFLIALDKVEQNGTYYAQDIIPIISKLFQHSAHKVSKNELSAREKEVLQLIIQEYTSKEIAEKLFISKLTVDTHRAHIMQKTGCKNLVGLIKYAVLTGLV